jgi:ribonuclease Z
MRKFHWGFKALDSIMLTHFHADHIAGLPGLMHTLAHTGKTEPLHILGPKGTYEVVSHLFYIVPSLPFEVFVQELENGSTAELASGVRVRVAEGEHRGPVLAYRFDLERAPAFLPGNATALGVPQKMWSQLQKGNSIEVEGRSVTPAEVLSAPRRGVSLGLATDTRPVPAIRDLMGGVDLLICEATYGDDADADKARERGHMTFREAATLAHNTRAGALWLTHFGVGLTNPGDYSANATDVFPNTTLGESGLEGTIAFETGYSPSLARIGS